MKESQNVEPTFLLAAPKKHNPTRIADTTGKDKTRNWRLLPCRWFQEITLLPGEQPGPERIDPQSELDSLILVP